MKIVKKITTLFLALALCLSFCGCFDKSWAIKADDETLPTGVYVFFLMQAYQEAMQKLSNDSKTTNDISSETIDDQSAPNWIVERALKMCKDLLTVEKKFTEMHLALTEDEEKKAQELTDSTWESSGAMLEKNYGINKDAVHRASSMLNIKRNKIFQALYGKDGTNPVSDEDLNRYYKDTYFKLLFYSKMPTPSGESSETNNSDSEKENNQNDENKKVETEESIQNELNGYADAINNGTKTLDQIREEIKKTDPAAKDAANDPLVEQIINPNSETLAPDVAEKVKGLEAGKATVLNLNNVYFLIYNNGAPTEDLDFSKDEPTDKNQESSEQTQQNTEQTPEAQEDKPENSENGSEQKQENSDASSKGSKRDNILYEMRHAEFEEELSQTMASINFNINYNAVNQFNPLMFKMIAA